MSYSIVYDRRVVKLGEDRFLLMINEGSNNCWEDNRTPAKSWGANKRLNGKTVLLSKKDIKDIAKHYDKCELAKARNNFFKEGEFERWINAGLKNSFTLEEALEWNGFNNTLCITSEGEISYFKKSDELLNAILDLEIKDNNFNISFRGRDFTPKKRGSSENKKELKNDSYKYVLVNPKTGILISVNSESSYSFRAKPNNQVKMFNSIEEIEDFKKNSPMDLSSFKIKQIQKKDKAYCLKDNYGYFFTKLNPTKIRYSEYRDSAQIFKTIGEAEKKLDKLNDTLAKDRFFISELNEEFYFMA